MINLFSAHPEGQMVVKNALQTYKGLLSNTHIRTDEKHDEIELVRQMLLAQFSMSCYQNLRGAFNLANGGDQYTPHALCRSVLEHYITWSYISKDPSSRIKQFVKAPIRKQILFTEILTNHIEKINLDANDLEKQKERLREIKKKSLDDEGSWERILENQATEAGLLDEYNMPYRLLCTIVHPDALQSEYFFSDASEGVSRLREYEDSKSMWLRSIYFATRWCNLLMMELAELFPSTRTKSKIQMIDKQTSEMIHKLPA